MQVRGDDDQIQEWLRFIHTKFVGVPLSRQADDDSDDVYSDDESEKDGEQAVERAHAIRMFLAAVLYIATANMDGDVRTAMLYNTVDPQRMTYNIILPDFAEANRRHVWEAVPEAYYVGHSTESVEIPTRNHIKEVTAVVVTLDARAIFKDVVRQLNATRSAVSGVVLAVAGLLINIIVWARLYHIV